MRPRAVVLVVTVKVFQSIDQVGFVHVVSARAWHESTGYKHDGPETQRRRFQTLIFKLRLAQGIAKLLALATVFRRFS